MYEKISERSEGIGTTGLAFFCIEHIVLQFWMTGLTSSQSLFVILIQLST